jgi:hypothetical protein
VRLGGHPAGRERGAHRAAEVQPAAATVAAASGQLGGELARDGLDGGPERVQLVVVGVHELDPLHERRHHRTGDVAGPLRVGEPAHGLVADEVLEAGDPPGRRLPGDRVGHPAERCVPAERGGEARQHRLR